MNLVTGATGIIGSHVVLELLRRGEAVRACRQKSSDLEKTKELFLFYSPSNAALFEKINWFELDISDNYSIEEALEGVTNVYHCAGFVSFNRRHRKKLFLVNEKGTHNLVNACLHKNIGAFCHVSSLGTINNLDHVLPLDEKVFWKKSGKESDYAISKYNGEREVWRGIEEGLNAVIVNPGVVLAPGFWNQSSSRLFEASYRGNPFYTNGSTGFVAASDVATIMVELVSRKKFGERYILIENNHQFKNIFDLIHSHLKKKAPFIKINRLALNIAWFFDSILSFFRRKEPTLTKATINSILNRQTYSSQKVCEALNYRFLPVAGVIENICVFYLSTRIKTKPSV